MEGTSPHDAEGDAIIPDTDRAHLAEFDSHAASYDQELQEGLSLTGEDKTYYIRGRTERLASHLRHRAFRPARVLDFGCGTGSAVPVLREKLQPDLVCGSDVSEASLEVARSLHPEARFLPGDGYVEAGPFDLCHCNGVFHHIPPAERDRCLASLRASIRPGGLLALFENNPLNPGTRLVMRRIPFDRDAIPLYPRESVARMRRAGFAIEAVDFLFYFPRQLSILRPLESLLYALPLGGQYLVLGRRL